MEFIPFFISFLFCSLFKLNEIAADKTNKQQNTQYNLGKYEEPPEWDEIFKYYSGTELKQHFEKIEQKQIRSSIKKWW